MCLFRVPAPSIVRLPSSWDQGPPHSLVGGCGGAADGSSSREAFMVVVRISSTAVVLTGT